MPNQALIWIALVCGGALLSVWDVLVVRKALNSPTVWAERVMTLPLLAIVASAVPLGARSDAHIGIEALGSRMLA